MEQPVNPERELNQVSNRIFTVPNVISFIRLLLVPVVFVLILRGHLVWAFAVLIVAGISDWLDGVIARHFRQVTKLGKFLDPSADRLFIFVTVVGLAYQGVIPWWLVFVLVAREVTVGACLPSLFRRGYAGFPVHVAGKAGTFALMYAFPLLLLSRIDGAVGTVAFTIGWAAALWGAFLYWVAALLYVKQWANIVRLEEAHGRF